MRRHFLAIDWIVLASLVVLNLLVIAPFLTMDFSSQPWNNDYTYIGMSRMFRDRPWSWNSLQYGGAPFHYLYQPLFHLIVMALPVRSLGRAYHLVSGAGYALVPAAFYIAALQLFRSRRLAAALAIVQSFSPTVLYYIVPAFAGFAGNYRHGPWNFVALVASNESAHTLSLALVLLVLAAAWRDRWMVASLCASAVFLMNWAGIIGLLMVLTAVAVARSRQLGYIQAALRVVGVAGVGYGLAAFWITPDCIYTTKLLDRVVLRHIQPSTSWNTVTLIVLAGAAILLAIGLWPRIQPAAAFSLALLAISGAVVVSYSATGNYLLPLPHRYLQEFNVGLVLAIGCLAAVAWKWRRPLGVLVLVLSAAPGCAVFLAGAWTVQQRSQDPRTTSAFQISDWLGSSRGIRARFGCRRTGGLAEHLDGRPASRRQRAGCLQLSGPGRAQADRDGLRRAGGDANCRTMAAGAGRPLPCRAWPRVGGALPTGSSSRNASQRGPPSGRTEPATLFTGCHLRTSSRPWSSTWHR
jgi:hypothetical protein